MKFLKWLFNRSISLMSIKSDGEVFHFKRPIKVKILYRGDIVYMYNEEFNINVWGPDKDSALEAFNFTFHSTLDNYAFLPDGLLYPGAIKLKYRLLELLRTTLFYSNPGHRTCDEVRIGSCVYEIPGMLTTSCDLYKTTLKKHKLTDDTLRCKQCINDYPIIPRR